MDEFKPKSGMEISGRIEFDPTTGRVSVDLETTDPFSGLYWSFSEDDEEFADVMEFLAPDFG